MKFTILSTTSKHNIDFIQLPNRFIFNEESHNFLVSKINNLEELLSKLDSEQVIIADCERKQEISIYNEVLNSPFNVIDYKPNDLTMEAADLNIFNFFNRDLRGKSVAIYGTGNIATKLALRLSERDVKVYIYGRNKEKIDVSVAALKQVTFNSSLVAVGNLKEKVDSIVSFVSAEEVVDDSFVNILNKNSLCLDGGIGNFTKSFIQGAINSGHQVRRLDVRQSQEIMDGYINSRLNSNFDKIIGHKLINGHRVVAGGIIGDEGTVIVDRITDTTKVIGIANGIGGVKHESELNSDEQNKIKEIQSYIE